jgi:RimJ/RimL family protein N-acetyltransferase
MTPPRHLDLGDGAYLRWFTVADAPAVARAVDESLDHLKPWMAWADARSGDALFQRSRLRTLRSLMERGEEWQYGVFDGDDERVLGSIGLMTRRGPATLEIGYWLHVDAGGHGYATRGAAALTEVARAEPGIRTVVIYCDEANQRSAAIPRRLGYTLAGIHRRAPEAPGETGREMQWTMGAA